MTPPLTDFADWLSPVLVKELRQGMRSRGFVISFLLLQGAMVLVAFFSLMSSADEAIRPLTSGLSATSFWGLVSVPLLLVLPFSALGTISGERKANTLPLLFLTQLSTRRIVFGKWLSVVLQALLLVCSVLPYAVLRYFLGGVNLGYELMYLLLMLVASALLTGITIGLSPLPVWVTRILLVGMVFLGQGLLAFIPMMLFGGAPFMPVAGMPPAPVWLGLLGLLVAMLLVPLEFGAAQIGAPSENHSTPLRIIFLGLLLLGAVEMAFVRPMGLAVAVPSFLLAGAILLGLLVEEPRSLHRIYQPFVRHGLPGRLLGRLLYPGWPGAVWLALLAVVAFYLAILPLAARVGEYAEWAVICVLAIGSLTLPLAIIRSVPFLSARPIVWLIALHAIFFVLYAMEEIARPTTQDHLAKAIPIIALTEHADDLTRVGAGPSLGLALAISGLSLLILRLQMLRAMAPVREAEARAAEAIAAEQAQAQAAA